MQGGCRITAGGTDTVPHMLSSRVRFEADGFYIHPKPLLSPDLIRRAAEGMDRIREGTHETGVPPQRSYWNPGRARKLGEIEMPQAADRAVMELVSPVIYQQ